MQELFGLTDDERQLRDSVEGFLRKDRLDNANPWPQLAELGWVGACVPLKAGGYAETGREALVIAERLGASGATAPLTAAVYAPARLLCADAEIMRRYSGLLGRIAEGKERLVIAWSELHRPFERTPERVVAKLTGGRWRIRGRKINVLGGPEAEHAIVSARTEAGTALFLIGLAQDGVEIHPYDILGGFKSADLMFHDVALPADALIASGDSAGTLLDVGLNSAASAACIDLVGAIEKALSITEEYVRTRKQFGQPIASFQVIQHRLVDLAINLEYSRSCEAILMCSTFFRPGGSHAPAALAGVRSEIMRRAQDAVADAVQLHGGIGMTEEAPIGHYFKRVAALANVWGNSDWQSQSYCMTRTTAADLLDL